MTGRTVTSNSLPTEMTPEEAAEVILNGVVWVLCTEDRCDDGQVRIEGGRGHDICINCVGYGSVVDADYVKACKVLGLPIPERAGNRTVQKLVEIAQVYHRSN